jgi:hypothetical protein
MNCQDVARILDDEDIARLSDDEQHALKLHLAFCPDCARDWELHAQMSATRIPAMSQELRDSCRALVVSGDTAAKRPRTGNRFILVGTVLVVAAAAAMLGVWLRDPDPVRAMQMPQPLPGIPVPLERETEAPLAADPVEFKAAPPAVAAVAVEAESPHSFTVAVLPLTQESGLPASESALKSFYSSLLENLRKVPDLVLVEQNASPRYRIAVKGLATITATELAAQEGRFPNSLKSTIASAISRGAITAESTQWRVEVVVDNPQQASPVPVSGGGEVSSGASGASVVWEKRSGTDGTRFTGRMGSYLVGECTSVASMAASMSCPDPAGVASMLVDLLRQQAFPAESALWDVLTRLQNSSTGEPSDNDMGKLHLLMMGGKLNWDADSIHAVVSVINSLRSADQRVRIWTYLSGVTNAELIQPLLTAMRNDPDEKVRLAVINILQPSRATDPAIRSVVEAVAREDERELVRQAAQRVLSGDAGWYTYVATNLRNTGLPAAQRLAPLAYMAQSNGLKPQLSTVMNDDAVAVLGGMLPGVWKDPESSQMVVQVLSALIPVNHAGARSLMPQVLRDAPERQAMTLIMAVSGRYPQDPEVRKMLDDASARFPMLRTLPANPR